MLQMLQCSPKLFAISKILVIQISKIIYFCFCQKRNTIITLKCVNGSVFFEPICEIAIYLKRPVFLSIGQCLIHKLHVIATGVFLFNWYVFI